MAPCSPSCTAIGQSPLNSRQIDVHYSKNMVLFGMQPNTKLYTNIQILDSTWRRGGWGLNQWDVFDKCDFLVQPQSLIYQVVFTQQQQNTLNLERAQAFLQKLGFINFELAGKVWG